MSRVPIDERIAIQELSSLYSVYCDSHQFEKLAELFTEDCVYDETCSGVARVTDKAALLRTFEHFAEFLGPVMHTCSNHVISDYTGASARGICYVNAEGTRSVAGGGIPIRVLGYYDDVYRKTGGIWYFKARVLKPLVPVSGCPVSGGVVYDSGDRVYGTRIPD